MGGPRSVPGDARPAPPAPFPAGRDPFWTLEVRQVRPPLVIDTGASARSATRVRREFAPWLGIDVTGAALHGLVLAVYEAVANIAEHAYAEHPDGPGPVRLLARRSRDAVLVTVADDGAWRAPTGQPHRGRGLALIGALVGDVHITRAPGGTVVQLRAAAVLPS